MARTVEELYLMRLLKTGEESSFVAVAARIPTADAARMSLGTSDTTIQLPAFLDSRLRGDSTGTRLTSTFFEGSYSHDYSPIFSKLYSYHKECVGKLTESAIANHPSVSSS